MEKFLTTKIGTKKTNKLNINKKAEDLQEKFI